MMYASKIQIKMEPEKVRYHKEIELPDGLLTLELLSKYLAKDDTFSISYREEDSMFGTTTILNIYGTRLETQEELDTRIAKQEKYNENYEIFHAKYKKS